MKSSLSLLVLSLMVLACSKVKKLDSMADATDNMEKTTKAMSENTGHMDTMYRQVRSKEAEDTRAKKYDTLRREEILLQEKISSAAVYFMSMEYQLATWEEFTRKPKVLNNLKRDAANDFIRKLGDLHTQVDLDELDPTKKIKHRNPEAMFNALSAALHFNHDHQEYLAEEFRMPTVSFYDLIKNALRKDKKEMDARREGRGVDHGVTYEHYEQILVTGSRKKILIDLLKARVDMLAAIALQYMSDKDMKLEQYLTSLTFLVSKGHFGHIDIPMTITEANSATKISAVEALDGALKAKRFLNEIGVEKKLVKTLKSAYSQLKLEGDRELDDIQRRVDELLK